VKANRQKIHVAEALLSLKNGDECQRFLRDICTLQELESMQERLDVAVLLDDGNSYREVSRLTGASTTTVTRVAHWLKHGCNGYRVVLDRLTKRK
jgi:TrpR-related protein YerC/YecD